MTPEIRAKRLAAVKKHYAKNRDRINTKKRLARTTMTAEARAKERAANKEWFRNNPQRVKELNLTARAKKYGITGERFHAALAAQSGLCGICTEPMKPGKDTNIDHCHKTGKFRSLLCLRCNVGLGHFREDSVLVRAAADYLEAHNG